MNENQLGLLLSVLLDPRGKEQILKDIGYIQEVVNKTPLKLKIDVDSAEFKAFAANIEKLGLSINKALNIDASNVRSDLDKFTRVTVESADSAKKVAKEIYEWSEGIGKAIKQIDIFDEKGENVAKTITQTTTNYKKIQQEQQKLLDDFNKKNINAIDYEIKQRELEAKQFANLLKAQMLKEQELEAEKQQTAELEKQIQLFQKQMSIQAQSIVGKYGSLVDKNDLNKLMSQINSLSVETPDVTNKMKEFALGMKQIEINAKTSSKALKLAQQDARSFGSELLRSVIKFTQWYIIGGVISNIVKQIKDGVKYIAELDNSLNEIRIVTNKTQEEVNQLAKAYNNLAREMSVTTKEITGTAAELYRQGLTDAEVEKRMRAIIQYAKISSISLDEANKIITATANATGESVQKIIDIFAYLGDMTAAGADEIGEALQRVASTAENAGLSLEKISSWIATISSITRESASTIGRSLNSMISRYEQIREKGFNEEDATKINDVTKALASVGIQATDAYKQLLPIGEVIDKLGAKWDTLTKNEKAYVATALAGTYQRNRLITLLDNYSISLKNYEDALNAAGTAEQKFAIYQESTQAALDRLKASWEDLWQNTISSDTIKTIINLGTAILNLVDKIGLLPVALSTAFGALFLLNKTFQTFAMNIAPIVLQKLGLIVAAENGIAIAANGAALSVKTLSLAFTTFAPLVIAGAIYGLAKAFDALNMSMSRYKEKVDESYNSTQSNINQIKQLKSEYESLAKKTELTKEEKLRLIEIERELNNRFAKTKEAIDLQNDSLETNIRKIDELAKAEANRFLLLNKREYEKALELLNSPYILADDSWGVEQFNSITEAIKYFENELKNATDKNIVFYIETKRILENLYKEYDSAIDIVSKYEGYQSLLAESVDETNKSLKNQSSVFQYHFRTADELAKIYENTSDVLDDFASNAKTLASVLEDVTNGEKITVDQIAQLTILYPKLASEIVKINESRTQGIQIVEKLWRIEKDRSIDYIKNVKAELEAELTRVETLKSAYKDYARAMGVRMAKMDVPKDVQDAIAGYGDLVKQINILDDLIKELEESTLSNFAKTSTKTKKEYTPSTEQEALKELLEAEKISLEEYYNRLLALEKSQYAEYANKSAAQLEQMLRSRNEEIAKKTEEYLALTTERKQVKTQLDTKAFEINISLLTNALDELKDAYGRLSDTDFDEKLANINQQADIQKRLIEAYNNELARLKKEYQAGNILLSEYSESVAELEDRIKDANRALKDLSISLPDVFRTQFKEYKKQIDKLMDEEEKAHKQRLDNIKKEKEAFIDYIDSQISELERLRAEEDYASDIAEITEELNKLQQERSKLALAAASGDMEAISKVNELNEKIAEQQKKLAKRQSDEEYRRRKQNLQDIKKTYQAEVDARIDAENAKYEAIKSNYEKLISDMELFTDANITLNVSMVEEIINSYNILADSFSDNVREMAKVFSIEFIDKLREAQKEIANLNRAMGGSAKITQPTTTLKHHSVLGEGFEKMSDAEFAQYVANKKKWEEGTITEAERKYNENLRKKYGIKEDKYSYWDLVGYYKDGGINTKPGLAILHGTPSNPEFIFNTEQMKRLVTNLAFNVAPPKYNIPKTGQKSEIRIDSLITVQGNVTKDTVPAIKNAGLGIVNKLKGLGVVINNG